MTYVGLDNDLPINVDTEDDPLWWFEGICEDCMGEDGTSTCSCGCLACADCRDEHADDRCSLGIRPEILASPEAMKRRAAHAKRTNQTNKPKEGE